MTLSLLRELLESRMTPEFRRIMAWHIVLFVFRKVPELEGLSIMCVSRFLTCDMLRLCSPLLFSPLRHKGRRVLQDRVP